MNHWKSGSYTVEAAMLMGILLFAVVAVLKGSIYVYDRAVDTAKEYEAKVYECIEEPNPVTLIRQRWAIEDLEER